MQMNNQETGLEIEIKNPPQDLIQFIGSCPRFIIAGHKEPDGDCIGSQLALRSALERLGKEVVLCSAGPFKRTEVQSYAGQFVTIPKDENTVDAKVIIIDCSDKERTGSIKEFLDKFPCAVIDHHIAVNHSESTPQQPVYIDENSPSCTLLVYKLIKALNLELTKEEATLLFFGLSTDNGFFRHLTEKNSVVFDAAKEMVLRGEKKKKIYNSIYGGKSLDSRILLGHILLRTESYFDGKLLLSYETLEDFKKYGIENRDSDILNQLMLSIKGVQVFLTIRQECEDNCAVSFRSVDAINVAKVASIFGGGGHKNASGLTMKGDISFVKQKMLEAFSSVFTD
jgi:phosphoesterase RecJ-like protein